MSKTLKQTQEATGSAVSYNCLQNIEILINFLDIASLTKKYCINVWKDVFSWHILLKITNLLKICYLQFSSSCFLNSLLRFEYIYK